MANERVREFEDFFASVLGCKKESFDPHKLLLQEKALDEALEKVVFTWNEDCSTAELQNVCRETQDLLTHFINKRDRLATIPSSISKDINSSRSCERTLHQCCMVLSEEIEALDREQLTVLDELEASIRQIQKIHASFEPTVDQTKVDDILRLNDLFLENVFNCDGPLVSKGNKSDDLRPGRSAFTIKSYLENIEASPSSKEDQSRQQKQELCRLQNSFQLCEAERFSASTAVMMSQGTINALNLQFHQLRNSTSLAPVSSADSMLLERQAETQEIQKQAAALYNDVISPLIRQLSNQQGVKFMRGACKLRLEEEQRALSAWARLQALAEWQQARLEMLEACLELDKQQDQRAGELIAAATEYVTRAAADKTSTIWDLELPKALGTESHIGDYPEDCERIFAVLGNEGDKFAMAFPTPADVLAAASRVGSAGPKAVADRAALIEAHTTLWSSLRRTAQAYDHTLHMMPAGPGRPIGMPSDLEEALQELAQAGGEADRNLEAVLQYRDAARQAAGPGVGAARVVADFFTQPERLQEEMEALRTRCAATGWCPPPAAAPPGL
jgi:hypothetical protein